MGRRSDYSVKLTDEICARIAEGEPLRQICRDEGMPNFSTVYDWLKLHDDFYQRFARAREVGEEAIAQDILDIADDARNDWMEKHDRDGKAVGWQVNGDHIQRSKLRAEMRLKLLAKWNPRKWADKVDLNHGGQPENPIKSETKNVTEHVLKQLTAQQIEQAIAEAQGDRED